MTPASAIYLILLIAGITILVLYSRSGRLLRCIVFSAFTGFLTLGGMLFLSRFTSFDLALTPLSAIVSGILGIPGVIGMLILNLI